MSLEEPMARKMAMIALMLLVGGSALAQTAPVPTNLKAEFAPTMGPLPVVKLSWDAPDGPWGYRIYRSGNDSLHFAPLAIASQRFYFDNTVAGGSVFFYQVRSFVVGADSHMVESGPSNTAWITISLPPPVVKGTIAGTVKDDTTGAPIQGMFIRFYRMDPWAGPFALPFAVTDSLGQYKIELPVGSYTIHAEPAPYMPPGPPPYIPEWFDNVYEQSQATMVKVEEGKTFTADFGLSHKVFPVRPKGTVSGTVIDDSSKKPLAGALIRFFSQSLTIMVYPPPTVVADSLGHYEALLDTAVYLIRAEEPPMRDWHPSYRPEWYDNVTEVGKATPVHVTPGSNFVADFGLSRFYPPHPVTIEGTVTDTSGNPLRAALVAIMVPIQAMNMFDTDLDEHDDAVTVEEIGYCRGIVWKGRTDSMGHYSATVLSGRQYIAMSAKWGYLTEYYDGKVNPLQADLIKADSDVKGINFSLAANTVVRNSISGSVRDSSGAGIPARVILFPLRPTWPWMSAVRAGHTDSTGTYTLTDVHGGKYFVLAVPFKGYAPAFYKEGAYGVRSWQKADTVTVSGDITGIDIGVVALKKHGLACVTGRVIGPDDKPLSGVRAFAISSNDEMVGFGLSDNTGAYAIDGLDSSPTTLTFDCEGYQTGQATVMPGIGQFSITAADVKLSSVATALPVTPYRPVAYQLEQNYPNPFNPTTTLAFDMPDAGVARLVIYNLLGQEIVTLYNSPVAAGRWTVTWDGKDVVGKLLPTGIYLVRFTALEGSGLQRFTQLRKMVLLK
jgi:hypothetical protein